MSDPAWSPEELLLLVEWDRMRRARGGVVSFPPTAYRHWWRGRTRTSTPVGDWPWPLEPPECRTSRDWCYLGWAPRPRSRWGGFRLDVGHGLAMGYPVFSVLVFALRFNGGRRRRG